MSSAVRAYNQSVRAASTEATGRRIVDAFLARVTGQWFDEITLDQVAADAEVTVQTVVRRFGGKEGLLSAAVETFAAQVKARRAAPSGDINRVIANLMRDYEAVGDGVIRLLALEARHPALKKVLDYGRDEHRRWVSEAFSGALSRFAGPARAPAIDALVIATDVYTWKLLRRDMDRSIRAASDMMKRLIHGILAPVSKSNHEGK